MSCNKPIYIKSKNMLVPCGRCFGCKKSKIFEWSIRLNCELQTHKGKALFITLTYDDDHYIDSSLNKKDLQDFLKRLRDKLDYRKIKYYAVGEYGDKSFRKHFHLILFNVYYEDKDIINDCWYNGFIDIAPVEQGSIYYVVGYVQKKLEKLLLDDNYYENLGYTPPFMVCSKGIALDYIHNYCDVLKRDMGIFLNGKKYPLPRYFREKLNLVSGVVEYDEYIDKSVTDMLDKLQTRYKNVSLSYDDKIYIENLIGEIRLSGNTIDDNFYKKINLIVKFYKSREFELKTKSIRSQRSKI